MRRAFKIATSEILTAKLQYRPTSKNNKIAEILRKEQKGFCAYTDEYISCTDAGDIDHFNPTLKGTPADNYDNWFFIKHQWNKLKASKWEKFQPVLWPTAQDFEERIMYLQGDYFAKSESDIEANNLIRLLQLDHPGLAVGRKRYIRRKRREMEELETDATSFFTILLSDDICQVNYLRAIKEEFGIDVWQMIK